MRILGAMHAPTRTKRRDAVTELVPRHHTSRVTDVTPTLAAHCTSPVTPHRDAVTTTAWPRRAATALAALLAVTAWSAAACSNPALGEAIGERIARFHADTEARATALPSIAMQRPFPSTGSVPEGFRTVPEFTSRGGVQTARIATARGTSLYGTGMVSGPLLRNGRVVTCWNTDAYGYGMDSPSLYQSHPWVLGVRADGSAFGAFADTPGRVVVDLRDGIEFRAQGAPFAVIAIERESPQDVLRSLATLIGTMPMPPRWALGYQQCRYSYFPDSEVVRIAAEFRRRDIPCDVVWMDIDYMDGYRSFTFDLRHFGNPAALNDTLHQMGFRSVWIIDPGIRREPGYRIYDEGTAGDHWVLSADGTPYVGRVWPGPCVFPDFTRDSSRAWWAHKTGEFAAHGADGIWNDMNEPAVFDVDGKSMPNSNRHRADPELGGPGPHARYHNVYGMQMARATREGMLAARPERRPFVLSRANHLGGQREAAAWTGDNQATWPHLQASIAMVLNLGLSGQPFSGPDIGGFAGSGDGLLFARWMGFGALLPFARGHSEKGTSRKEPWSFGADVENTCRRAIATRYRLLPYLYGTFREASLTGLPIARPLMFADPSDSRLRREDSAFLIGADLMVVADLTPYRLEDPVLPRGIWRPIDIEVGADGRGAQPGAFAATSARTPDPDLPRLYVRGGSILPLAPVAEHSGAQSLDSLELVVCPDVSGAAHGTLYEDAGDGYGHERGEYRLTRFRAVARGDTLRVSAEIIEGNWKAPKDRVYRVRVADAPRAPRRVITGP